MLTELLLLRDAATTKGHKSVSKPSSNASSEIVKSRRAARRSRPTAGSSPLREPRAPAETLARAWIAAPAAAAIASHATALTAGFVWLDHAHIEAGYALAPPSGWLALFTRGFAGTGFYRPLMSLSLSLDALVGAPWLYHAVSLAWHAAAAVAVVFAASALGSTRRVAVLAGVLFAVHPTSSLVANAIAFRSEAMIAVALLGLVVAHRRRRPVLAALAVLGGALTKETALVLAPLFILALEATGRGLSATKGDATKGDGKGNAAKSNATEDNASEDDDARKARQARRRLLVAEGAALAVALGLRLAFAPAFRADHPALSASEAIGTRLASVGRGAAAALAPLDRTVCDAFPITPWTSPWALAGAVVVVLLAWLAWRRRGAALLLALSLLPVLQMVPVMRWWSPHYVYVALAFGSILVAEAIARTGRRRGFVVAGVAAALLGLVTLLDGARYTNDEALWRPEVDARPACREGQFYLGEVARGRRAWAEAETRYEAALAPWPGVLAYVDRAAALQNLGTVRLEQGDLPGARQAFVEAIAASEPAMRRRLEHNLAGVALRSGDPAECWRLLEPEVARDDALPESIYLAAKALHALHREAETRALILRLKRLGWTGQPIPAGSAGP